MIEIDQLIVRYGKHVAVNKLDLNVEAGCVYALLGGNGAGKTSTFNAILGFLTPAGGTIKVNDIVVSQARKTMNDLAYLPENIALYPYMSGVENLIYFSALSGKRLSKRDAHDLLSSCGLSERFHQIKVSNYSKGMRQKVGLAIVYARNTKALLLDEPTSGLDPSAANDFAQRIKTASESGMAILMATHDLFNAKQVADKIGILQRGQLVVEFDAHTVDHEELERKYLALARENIV